MEIKNKESFGYNLLYDYDFLLVPIANAVSGSVGFGLPGCLAGVTIGIIDEVLISYNYTSNRYLSPIIQGASSFATLTSSWLIRGIGSILSLVLFKITISESNEYTDKIVYPAQIALHAGYTFGWKGALGGIILSMMEEVFIHNDIYDKHFISPTISIVSFTHLLKNKINVLNFINQKSKLNLLVIPLKKLNKEFPYFFESIAMALNSIYIVHEQDHKIGVTAFNIQKEIKAIYIRLGKESLYVNMLEKQVIISSGFAVVEQFLNFKLMNYLQKHNAAFFGGLTTPTMWESFKSSLKDILIVLPLLNLIKQVFINPLSAYFSFQSQNQLYNAVSDKWIIGEIPLKILQKENTETLIDNLNKDITIIANNGEELRKNFYNDIIKSSYSQYLLYQHGAQDLIIIYHIYYSCTEYISEKLSKFELSYNKIIRDLESKRSTIVKHDARNVQTVVERDGFIYSKRVLDDLDNDIKVETTKQLLATHLYESWKKFEILTNDIFTFTTIGYKIHIGDLHSDVGLKILAATDSVVSLMSWGGKNSRKIEEVSCSIKNLNSFIDKVDSNENISSLKFNQLEHVKNELALQNLHLSIANKELLYIKEINLQLGTYYALTGTSGSGKSSLLSKIKGITYNNVKASGIIKYPYNSDKKHKVVLMSQDDFFPTDSTLLEAIYYPQIIPVGKKEEVYYTVFKMLYELDLCNGNNGEKDKCDIENFMDIRKDWNTVLSGGQKKKALLISALIQQPKILLLDEPFTGLDPKAISHMQLFIKEKLQNSNTLVICIDHHASDSISFYDFELSIKNNTLELKKFDKDCIDNTNNLNLAHELDQQHDL